MNKCPVCEQSWIGSHICSAPSKPNPHFTAEMRDALALPAPRAMTDDVRTAVWVQFMDGGESGASLQAEYGLTHWQVEEALRWAWKQYRP